MNGFAWLATPCNANQSNLERFAELCGVNGFSMVVTKFGPPVPDPAFKYKRKGLTAQEAMELCYMRGCLEGIVSATDPASAQPIHELIGQEMAKTGKIVVPTSLEVQKLGK